MNNIEIMRKTRKIGGNYNLQNINTTLFENTPKNALIYPGVPNLFNEKPSVSFRNTPQIHPLHQNVLLSPVKRVSTTRRPRKYKSMNAEIKKFRNNIKTLPPNAEVSNETIKGITDSIKRNWYDYKKHNRRTAVRRGNLSGLTNNNISRAHLNISKQSREQEWAANFAKFIQNSNINSIASNNPANIRKELKYLAAEQFSPAKHSYFERKINEMFRN
jgi:hypothetical protein